MSEAARIDQSEITALGRWIESAERSTTELEAGCMLLRYENDRTQSLAIDLLHKARCLNRGLLKLSRKLGNRSGQLT